MMGSGLALMACTEPTSESGSLEIEEMSATESIEAAIQGDVTGNRSDDPTVRSADSHIHGGAVLSIVSEKQAVFVELETPLHNLLGFEYTPRSSAEKATVIEAEARLSDPKKLFGFNAEAKCTYAEVEKPPSLFDLLIQDGIRNQNDEAPDMDDHDDHQNEASHSDDHYDHYVDPSHADNHDTHSENDEDHGAEHKDVILRYALTCRNSEKLKTVEVSFFEYFPNLAELDLVYLGPLTQISAELSPSNPTADLTR